MAEKPGYFPIPPLLICHKYLQYVLDQLLPKLPIKLCAQKCGHVGRAKFILVIELTWHGLHAFLTNSSSGQEAKYLTAEKSKSMMTVSVQITYREKFDFTHSCIIFWLVDVAWVC